MQLDWQRFLPEFLVRRLEHKQNIVSILANTFWLVSDRLLRMGVGLFIGAWVARYLSPDLYGKLNNALAFTTLLASFTTLGLDNILIRDLVKSRDKKDVLMGTAFCLRLVSGFIMYFCALLIIFFTAESQMSRTLVYVISIGLFFQSFDIIDFYFQSLVKAKYTVFAKNAAFLISSAFKLILLLSNASLIWFAWAFLSEMVLNGISLALVYRKKGLRISNWKFDKKTAFYLLRESWSIYLAYISAIIYMKIDQLMIAGMKDDYAAGQFAASTKLYEIPMFLSIVIASSVFPSLVNLFQSDRLLFHKRMLQVSSFLSLLGYLILALTLLSGSFFISLLFGNAYLNAFTILSIQMFGIVIIFNGALRGAYLTITSNQRILMYTTILSALFNILFNLALIPRYGPEGAAFATVITQLLSLFLLNMLFKNTRQLFFIQLQSFLLLPFLFRKKYE